MKKVLLPFAALAMSAAFALPAWAGSTEQRADGMRNLEQIEVSAQRRYWRHGRYYGPRRYRVVRPYRGYRYARPYWRYRAPYYAYAPWPYWGPGVRVGVGPFGFGFRF